MGHTMPTSLPGSVTGFVHIPVPQLSMGMAIEPNHKVVVRIKMNPYRKGVPSSQIDLETVIPLQIPASFLFW